MNDLKPSYAVVNDIISKFDFELVRSYMVVNKWYWQHEKKAPSIEDMRYTATSLLIEVVNSSRKNENDGYTFSSTGGFKASYYKRCNEYRLEFVIQAKYTSGN